MPSTYTTNLGIEKIATGEQSGTWGTTTNTNLDLLDEAVNGVEQVTLPAAGSSGSPNDLPVTNGASSDGRNKFIEFVDGGDLGGTAYVQLTPNDAEKIVFIRNSLSAARNIIIFQGTYNASNDFEIPNGADVVLKFDGAGAGAVVSDVYVNLTPTKLTTAEAQVDNININGNAITSTDTNGNIALTPDGTGEVDISKVDIDSGTIDGVTIGGASAGAATFTTITGSGDMAIDTDTLFVDVSENRVGIGTTDVRGKLQIGSGNGGGNTPTGHELVFGANNSNITFLSDSSNTSVEGEIGAWNTVYGTQASKIVFDKPVANASQLLFYTGLAGSVAERMRIDSSGNVGIGVSSPAHPLSVENPDGNTNTISMINNSSNLSRLAFVQNGSTTAAYSSIDADGRSTGFIRFNTNDAERMRIDSSGNVGIGTTSPSKTLDVNGNIRAEDQFQGNTSSGESSPAFSFDGDADTGMFRASANNLGFGTNGTEAMRIDSSGNVGIGTSSPNYQLHATTSFAVGASGFNQQLSFTNDTIQSLLLGTGYTALKLNPLGGNVGIGTTSPSTKIHAVASAAVPATFERDGSGTIATFYRNTVTGNQGALIGADSVAGYFAGGNNTRNRLYIDSASEQMQFFTANTERMRIASNGNVGIRTTSLSAVLTVSEKAATTLATFDSTSARMYFGINNTATSYFDVDTLIFRNSPSSGATERMRIDSSGAVCIGTSVPNGGAGDGELVVEFAANSENAIKTRDTDSRSGGTHLQFISGSSVVGTIKTTTTSTSYNTSSDYRLKENVVDITDAIDRVKALKPSRFNFIANPNKTVDGFLAHEAQEIVPEAVTGEKDGVDKDGKPEYQGIDQSKLVPLLTGALKEAIARIETLEAEVAALKGA